MPVRVVRAGDTLSAIASSFGVSAAELARVNGLPSAAPLIPGLALYIPNERSTDRLYILKDGDTLWNIAQRYHTTVERILSANSGLRPDMLTAGRKVVIPSPDKLHVETLAFSFPASGGAVITNLKQQAARLTYLAITAYSFKEEGNAYAAGDDQPLLSRSKQLNVNPLLMIRNFSNEEFSTDLVGGVLANDRYRSNLVSSITTIVRQKGYGGACIDFEFIPPSRRNDFAGFLRELKTALGTLILHVNVHAKTEDNPTNRIVGGHDYRAIGNAADLVAVMTIDYGYPTGPPNPVSPIGWMEEVLRYATATINPRKIQAGFPLYGYDWTLPGNQTRALSVLQAQSQAISRGSVITYDQSAASPTYQYWQERVQHVVWFEDIRSFIRKYQLVDAYNLLGTTFWQLGLDFPQNWEYMKDHIIVEK
ncbi:LysM peptidoglycan-binding domain-containing protein [Peribacillus cavernae]|uniref:LysM peptidoglycan-binding domain-containing protein n=1 Tax=Peribacillus cavernae TaxID=1674310 RepID=A0A433HIP2_9BACI|nr:LysM peptidoglycan-binding domain-containing protein [Peribacillus cavernae]MDQ0217774.1 spore germination protein [Peribacillus cavernae]RUQ28228.1 LysM peptidoglycan-binding domain-containing protein [Peribacillus cavernae]